MTDTASAETGKSGDSQTTVTTTASVPADNAVQAEVERLRKVAEQAEMRANQLKNELDKRDKADEDAERKRLQDKEEWKTLAEQEAAKRGELEAKIEAQERKRELSKATKSIFADYSEEVVEIAKTTGLSLEDTDDASAAELKAKLDKIAEKVPRASAARASNPAAPRDATKQQLLTQIRRGTREQVEAAVGQSAAVKAWREQAGYSS